MSGYGEPVFAARDSHLAWSAIFAGAIGAAGVSFALNAFALGVGLAVSSTAPTWRDSSAGLWWLSGIYLLFVALLAFGFGGYVAGRMRAPLNTASPEMEFRDGMHGLITWGLAVVITALLALGLAATASPAVAPSGGSQGASQSVAGENIIASELDELFRSDRLSPNMTYRRAEAARILLKADSHNGVSENDRAYLARIVGGDTGLAPDEARARVDNEIDQAKRELHRARVATVLEAFFAGAALFLGAAVAWFSGVEGGRDREAGRAPVWDWSFRRKV
jgi:hypothetical protein